MTWSNREDEQVAITIRVRSRRSGGPGPNRSRRGSFRRQFDTRYSPYVFISPFFALFAIVALFPIAYTAWVSLNDWNLIRGQGEFVGFANYQAIFDQRLFWIALRNTLSIFVIHLIPLLIFAIAIAAALDRSLRAGGFWRLMVLLPFVVMPVAVTLIFGSLYAERYGMINTILESVGIGRIGWYSDVFASHVAIASMVDYRWTGYAALIFLAGMQAISRDYYEAATIDGAGAFRQFFSITIPQLRGTIIFVVITSTIGGLQIFDEPRLYDTAGLGGADGQWLTLALYLYNVGWRNLNFGQASAIAWVLFAIVCVFALVSLWLTSRIAKSEGTR